MWIQQWQQEFALRFTKYVGRETTEGNYTGKNKITFTVIGRFLLSFQFLCRFFFELCEVENHEKFSQSWFHFVSHCRQLWRCWNCHSCDNFPTKYIYNNRHSERALTVMSWRWGWGRIISSRLCERHAEETRDAGTSPWPIRVAPCGK